MRWTLLIVLGGLVLPASAAAAPAQVRLAGCEPGRAIFEGSMRAVPGSARMQMRFTLQTRPTRDDEWVRVAGPRLDTWVGSDPGKLRYVYDKRVDGLVAPADYRARVRFRWVDAAGGTIARTHRESQVCRQRDPRPDLRLTDLRLHAGQYLATVRNAGRQPASPFDVSLELTGSEPVVQRAGALEPGEQTTVAFDAPACRPGSALEVVVDAAEEVDEAAEGDDVVALPCPDPS